jgi:hypothetical protein
VGGGGGIVDLGTSLDPKLTPPAAADAYPNPFSSSNWLRAGVNGKRLRGKDMGVATRSLNASESPPAASSAEL